MRSIWLVLVLAGCGTRPAPPADAAACAAACDTLARLGCATARATPEGATCVERCEHTEASGYTTQHAACVALATSCADAEHRSAYGCEP